MMALNDVALLVVPGVANTYKSSTRVYQILFGHPVQDALSWTPRPKKNFVSETVQDTSSLAPHFYYH